jgi:hypothetical protein
MRPTNMYNSIKYFKVVRRTSVWKGEQTGSCSGVCTTGITHIAMYVTTFWFDWSIGFFSTATNNKICDIAVLAATAQRNN